MFTARPTHACRMFSQGRSAHDALAACVCNKNLHPRTAICHNIRHCSTFGNFRERPGCRPCRELRINIPAAERTGDSGKIRGLPTGRACSLTSHYSIISRPRLRFPHGRGNKYLKTPGAKSGSWPSLERGTWNRTSRITSLPMRGRWLPCSVRFFRPRWVLQRTLPVASRFSSVAL